MADIPTILVTVLGFLFAMVKATSVDITHEWKPNIGWEVTCSWNLLMNDSLQSVKLFNNKQQFMIYRPDQTNSPYKRMHWDRAEHSITVECLEAVEKGLKGKCVMTIMPLMEPRRDFHFGCEVSGERPHFRVAEKEVLIKTVVPLSSAVMEVIRPISGPISLNCSASGFPPPTFVWTVNDIMVPHDFQVQSNWNQSSKLYTAWSTFTPQTSDLSGVKCTPEVIKDGELFMGEPAAYSGAGRRMLFVGAIILTALTTLIL